MVCLPIGFVKLGPQSPPPLHPSSTSPPFILEAHLGLHSCPLLAHHSPSFPQTPDSWKHWHSLSRTSWLVSAHHALLEVAKPNFPGFPRLRSAFPSISVRFGVTLSISTQWRLPIPPGGASRVRGATRAPQALRVPGRPRDPSPPKASGVLRILPQRYTGKRARVILIL